MFRNITPVVKNLLIINVGLLIVSTFILPQLSDWFALYYIHSPYFQPFQFLTYMFMHADFWHLFGNMLGLVVFGPMLEQFLGPKKLLTLWMVCGVGAGVMYSGYIAYEINSLNKEVIAFQENPSPDSFNRLIIKTPKYLLYNYGETINLIDKYSRDENNPNYIDQANKNLEYILAKKSYTTRMVGASGALFGVLIAFAMLFPNTQLFLLFPPVPIKAKYMVLFYTLYTIYNIFKNSPTDNVAHFAHLSGLIIGAVLIYFWKKDRNSFY